MKSGNRQLPEFALIAAALACLSAVASFQGGCGGTSTGNPNVDIRFGSYTAWNQLYDFFIPSTYAALSNGKICIRRLRFKATDTSEAAGGDIDFQPGEISLNAAGGTPLGTVSVPNGIYERIEFDLTNNGAGCTSGNSVSFTNSTGTFSTTNGVTIKFEGIFSNLIGGRVLTLGLQGIVDALNTVTSNGTIVSTLQNASVKGNF